METRNNEKDYQDYDHYPKHKKGINVWIGPLKELKIEICHEICY